LLSAAGIDTSHFKAHSTRSAATSKAKLQGLSVEQIVHKANWAGAKTFAKFYDKEVIFSDGFQNAILK